VAPIALTVKTDPDASLSLVELADRRASALVRQRSELQRRDPSRLPARVAGYSPRFASIAGLTIGSSILAWLLNFGFYAGFGCVFLALATALAPAGTARRVLACALVSSGLAQLMTEIAGPFTWVARFGFVFILMSTGVWYATWRFADL
jgi:hypothetical protein